MKRDKEAADRHELVRETTVTRSIPEHEVLISFYDDSQRSRATICGGGCYQHIIDHIKMATAEGNFHTYIDLSGYSTLQVDASLEELQIQGFVVKHATHDDTMIKVSW